MLHYADNGPKEVEIIDYHNWGINDDAKKAYLFEAKKKLGTLPKPIHKVSLWELESL